MLEDDEEEGEEGGRTKQLVAVVVRQLRAKTGRVDVDVVVDFRLSDWDRNPG